MKSRIRVLAMTALLGAPLLATAALQPAETGVANADAAGMMAPGDEYRVSALIKTAGGTKVGLINTENDDAFFLGEGQAKGSIKVISADYEKEEVVLSIRGVEMLVRLSSDPNAEPIDPTASAAATAGQVYRGEGIERFLREHPEALVKSYSQPVIAIPPEGTPPVEGFGEGIEAVLQNNPELREKLRRPVEGFGEGIESMLGKDPETVRKLQQPAEGLGEGIEGFLKADPGSASQGNNPSLQR